MRRFRFIFIFSYILVISGCSRDYTISLHSDNGDAKRVLQFSEGDPLEIAEPLKEGHSFDGWYLDHEFKQEFTDLVMPKKNLTLYAKWEMNSYTITFDEKGGTDVKDLEAYYQSEMTLPIPQKENYEFMGWYKEDQTLFNEQLMPSKDLTLYAKWAKYFTLTFETNGGDSIEPLLCLEGFTIGPLPTPIKDSYKFVGWYTDEDLQDPFIKEDVQYKDLTLYAKWELVYSELQYTYLPIEDAYLVNGYDGEGRTIVIPSLYYGKKVIGIGNHAFENQKNITNVIFEEGSNLLSIGDYAFSNTTVFEITIPKSVKMIGNGAFYLTTSLYSLQFEEGSELTTIHANAFVGTRIQSLNLPKDLTFIANNNLHSNELESIHVHPENLTFSSENGVLFNKDRSRLIRYPSNKKEEDYTLPESVNYLEVDAFFLTRNLKKVYFAEESKLKSIGNSAFRQSSITAITIPKAIESIGEYAFAYTRSLHSIQFEEGSLLTKIYPHAFSDTGLTTITIPQHVATIGNDAFENALIVTINVDPRNESFSSVNGVLYNTDRTELLMYPSGKLDEVFTVPSSVQIIKATAFLFTKNLKEVDFTVDSELTTIEDDAFFGTTIQSVRLPASLTTLGKRAFHSTPLLELSVSPNNLTYSSQDHVLYNKDKTILYLYASGRSEEVFTVLRSVEVIGDYAFYGSGIKHVRFEEGSELKRIRTYAFSEAPNLTSILLPKSLETIESAAFFYSTRLALVKFEANSQLTSIHTRAFEYTALTELTIPRSVSYIGVRAFNNIGQLTIVYFEEDSQIARIDDKAFETSSALTVHFTSLLPPTLGDDVFNRYSSLILLVPKESEEDYKSSSTWRLYSPYIYSR